MHTIITRHDITEILLKVAQNTINHHFLHFTLLFVMKYVFEKTSLKWNHLQRTLLAMWMWLTFPLAAYIVCDIFRRRKYKLPSSNQSILRIYTLRHIRIEINHGSQNVFWVLTWIGGFYPEPENYSMIYFLNLTFRC